VRILKVAAQDYFGRSSNGQMGMRASTNCGRYERGRLASKEVHFSYFTAGWQGALYSRNIVAGDLHVVGGVDAANPPRWAALDGDPLG
jgi:hypothetical protein